MLDFNQLFKEIDKYIKLGQTKISNTFTLFLIEHVPKYFDGKVDNFNTTYDGKTC